MKKCTKCLTDKPESEYYFKGRKSDMKLQSECKVCFNSRMMTRYEKRAAEIVAMKGSECLLCGYDKCPAALEFHHVDPSIKDSAVSQMLYNSKEKIEIEIAKCVVLCSNCHRKHHAGVEGYEINGLIV